MTETEKDITKMNFDIEPLLNEVKTIIETSINNLLKDFVEKYKLYEETYNGVLNLPAVRKINQAPIQEREKINANEMDMFETTKQIVKEEDRNKTLNMNWPTPGETLIIGRNIGQELKESYGLEFNPVLIDMTRLLAVSPKAIKIAGKMTIKRGNICMCCGRELTDEFSMLTKMGKTCAGHMKVEYIKNKSEVERFRNDYLKRVEEIGEMEMWIPKKQIRRWDSTLSRVVETLC